MQREKRGDRKSENNISLPRRMFRLSRDGGRAASISFNAIGFLALGKEPQQIHTRVLRVSVGRLARRRCAHEDDDGNEGRSTRIPGFRIQGSDLRLGSG